MSYTVFFSTRMDLLLLKMDEVIHFTALYPLCQEITLHLTILGVIKLLLVPYVNVGIVWLLQMI